jgi:hypothetical protein
VSPRIPDRRDKWIAALVFVVTLAALMIGSRTQGNTRDEGYYFDGAEIYWSWYGNLGDNLLHGHPGRSFTVPAISAGCSWL